jgi:hypothetical protein
LATKTCVRVLEEEVMTELEKNKPTADSASPKESMSPDATGKHPKAKPVANSEGELSEKELDKAAGGLNPQPLPPREIPL